MRYRYKYPSALFPFARLRLFSALRDRMKEGYSGADFRSDLMAGLVVGMVAIPLGMALAIASGVKPEFGLYTVIIAGALVALLGGSRHQVSGPTAAFVVILAPIAHKWGFSGLLVAGFMAGLILMLMGLARMGKFIQFIPHPVTTGFTAGIGIVIATLQLKDFFGLHPGALPDDYLPRVATLIGSYSTFSLREFLIGATTLALLLIWPRFNKKIPAPLIALTTSSVLAAMATSLIPGFQVATIGSVFGGIPQSLPSFQMPWNFTLPGEQPFVLSLQTIEAIFPSAFAIAMLGAIESLLSAVVADGMAQTKHDPDSELIALGVGNVVAPFFGGIAATGAIARTATNIRFGATSPISAVIHAAFALLVVLILAPAVAYLPMAALSALLLLVAYNMAGIRHVWHIIKVAPRSDVIVLLLCLGLTVVFDMVVGVTVGVVLAAMLFMRRMAAITSGHALAESETVQLKEKLPSDILLYEIAGPLFFGAAENAMNAVGGITDRVRTVIFVMEAVPVMDVTGLVALESAIEKLLSQDRYVILAGVKQQPLELIHKSNLRTKIEICSTTEQAIMRAKETLLPAAENPPLGATAVVS
ncbi:MAG: C4-dicarboxylic acid transporter DauA [Bdellovibrionales bacterium GWB1_55_8]|nr:MAG: C4-dicarboxylic acid transporter DauA [Bdellovibrionales bacterium GWB1_55_8]